MNFEDASFVERFRGRDPEAIRTVVEAYLPHALKSARAAGLDGPTSEDVVQETFTTFVEKAGQFEGRSHVRTWLFGILYRKIAESRRRLQRGRQEDDIDELESRRFAADGTWSRPPQPIEVYGVELRAFLEGCLELLPTAQRSAFVLREVDQLPTEEICKILEVTRTNLGVLLYRGRNRLRDCLESKGVNRE